MLALGLLLLGCGGSREGGQQQGGSQEESAQEPVAGEFVGFARDSQGVAGIAAIADPVPSEGGARDVKVYYCDGAQTAEWFRVSADGNSIDFTSEDGDASVLATLTEELVTGKITLADGRTLDFESAPANGLAGLYPSEVTERGFSSVSERGVQLEGEKVADGLVITATLPSDESRRSDLLKGDEEWTSGSYRSIVVPASRGDDTLATLPSLADTEHMSLFGAKSRNPAPQENFINLNGDL